MTCTEARERLSETIDQVCNDHAPVTVTKSRGRAVVIMSLEDYESLLATSYLLRSPRNATRLFESIRSLRSAEIRSSGPGNRNP